MKLPLAFNIGRFFRWIKIIDLLEEKNVWDLA